MADERRPDSARGERVPPGQGVTRGWPLLHVGEVPPFEPATWRLRVHGAVERELKLDFDGLRALPRVERTADMHCVTGWSRLACRWSGVSLRELAELAGVLPGVRFVRFKDAGFYDTSVPREIALADDALLALEHDGVPLTPEHGGPLRAVIPRLYGWKSCKWVREVEFLSDPRLGFWEVRGYRDGADPWREERLV